MFLYFLRLSRHYFFSFLRIILKIAKCEKILLNNLFKFYENCILFFKPEK